MPDPRQRFRPADVPDTVTREVIQGLADAQARAIQAMQAAAIAVVPWIDVAGGVGFQNGWVNYGAPYTSAAYRTNLDGTISLRGLIKNGALGLTAFVAPAGPLNYLLFPANANNTPGSIAILPGGAIQPFGGSNVYVTLDGITFATN